MKHHISFVCLFVVLFICLLQAGSIQAAETQYKYDTIYEFSFEGPDALKGWDNCKYATLKQDAKQQQYLEIVVPEDQGSAYDYEKFGSVIMRYQIDPRKIAGKRIFISGLIKDENVSKPTVGWLGTKLSLHYKTPDGKYWRHPNNIFGTFDWTNYNAYAGIVPEDITEACIYVGLQESTGKACFDDLKICALEEKADTPQMVQKELFKWHDLPRLRGLEVNKLKLEQAALQEDNGKSWNPYTISKLWKCNIIRYQMVWPEYHELVKNGDPKQYSLDAYNAWLESELVKVDRLLELCRKEKMYVVVNLFTWPGSDRLFMDAKYQDRLVEIWQMLAKRYKDHEAVAGFDMLNEPHESNVDIFSPGVLLWQELAERVAVAIRHIDRQTPIIMECSDYCNAPGYEVLKPLPVERVVYSIHMYYPFKLTHQGLEQVVGKKNVDVRQAYPAEIDGVMWDKARLKKVLEPVRKFQQKYNVPMYVGEFSSIRWAPGESSYNWLKDVIEIYEEYDWDWTYHAFREFDGWSVEIGGDKDNRAKAGQPTKRELLLKEWFAKNKVPDLNINK